MAEEKAWQQVDQYARDRRDDRADLFGWSKSDGMPDEAVFLIDESSDSTSFPESIAGIRILLKRVSTPEEQV